MLSIRHFLKGPYTLTDATGHSTETRARVPHRWLPGDTVNPATGEVIRRETHRSLIGIVDFTNRTGQGFTSRNVPLYLVHPLDPAYPPMLMASNTKYTVNQFAIVSVEHWNSAWPRAGLSRLLGPVGDLAIERQAQLLRATGTYTSMPETTIAIPFIPHHTVGVWETVLHIDPEGCEDVDDILCWRHLPDDGGYEFGIGIADVAAWVPEGSAEDVSAKRSAQTLYVDGTMVSPMLPTSLSTRLASLRSDGLKRPVLLLIYVVRGGVVRGVRWSCECICVTRTFTYESVLADAATVAFLPAALGIVTGGDVGGDPHVWIERAMITYNETAAAVLRSAGVGVLRRHEGRSSAEWGALAAATGCAEIALLGMKAGQYVDASTKEDVSHVGLGLAVYCHASSPLRRYADLINQRWLKHLLFSEVVPTGASPGIVPPPVAKTIADHLNARNRVAKEFDRNLAFLAHLRTDCVTEVSGIVLSAKKDGVRWKVYVPVWKRTIAGRGDGVIPGDRVTVRAYLNLTAPRWDDRLVCSLVKKEPTLTL